MLWLSGAALVVGYLVGSLPTAYLAARRAARRFADIRDLGDGNSGAGNMGRIYGRGWGIAVGVVDIAKGIAPVFAFNILVSLISTDTHEPLNRCRNCPGQACWLAPPPWLGISGPFGFALGAVAVRQLPWG